MNTAETEVKTSDLEGVERELCRTCLEPNEPGSTFCKDCGAPLSSYASTGPFESLQAEGHVYRQAVEHPQKLVVFLGVWLLFGFTACTGAFVFALNLGRYGERWGGVLGLTMFGLGIAILWRTTRNYFRLRSLARSATSSAD